MGSHFFFSSFLLFSCPFHCLIMGSDNPTTPTCAKNLIPCFFLFHS